MRFHSLRFLSLLLFLFITSASAQTAEKRVLFIVETSKETKSLAEAEKKLVSALVETGLGGLLEANDSFGIWTFNEALHVGKFPMQRWAPEEKKQLVMRVQDFLKMQPHEKTPRIETVWRLLQSVIRDSPALMVVLVTSGKHSISGTPFDEEINRHLKGFYRDYQKKKTPAVVVLSATSGKVLRYSVNPAIGDIRIPILTMPTNAAPVIAQALPAPKIAPPPSKPVAAPNPAAKSNTDAALIITKGGTKNVSRLEADQISTDNYQRNPVPQIAQVPAPNLPPLAEIKGPMILKHEHEVVIHEIEIKPPSPKAAPQIQPSPEKAIAAEIAQSQPVVAKEPKPTGTQVSVPIQSTAFVSEVAQEAPTIATSEPKVTIAEIPKPTVIERSIVTPIAPVVEVPPQAEKPKPVTPLPEPIVPVATVLPNKEPVAVNTNPTQALGSLKETIAAPMQTSDPAETQPAVTQIPTQPLLAQTSPQATRSLSFLFGAIGLMLVAVVLAFLIGRKMGTRPQRSLVSDWAERDRMKK